MTTGGDREPARAGERDGAGRDDLAVVHLVSHGERGDGEGTLFALGSDGVPHPDTGIAHWLTVQQATGQPSALFLLDLCSAGTSARLPRQVRLERPMRGWVIAACGPAESAYDGRFTDAVITVLEALAAGELDIDLFVTIGSPLAMPGVVAPRLHPAATAGGTPPRVRRWVDVADVGDLVAIPRTGLRDRFDGVERDLAVTIGEWDFHTATGYLRHPEVAAPAG